MKKNFLKKGIEFLKRFPATTPDKNKKRGRIATVLGTAAAALIFVGAVSNPIGLAALYTVSAVCGSLAISDGSKVEKGKE